MGIEVPDSLKKAVGFRAWADLSKPDWKRWPSDSEWDGVDQGQDLLDSILQETEYLLDTERGKTIDMMRLERYVYWYTDKGYSARNSAIRRFDSELSIVEDFNHRHDYLIAFNPLGINMLKIRLQLYVPRNQRRPDFPLMSHWSIPCWNRYTEVIDKHDIDYEDSVFVLDKDAEESLMSTWSREEWRAFYPNRIPPIVGYTWGDNDIDTHCSIGFLDEHGFKRLRTQIRSIEFGKGERMRAVLKEYQNRCRELWNDKIEPTKLEVIDIIRRSEI